MNERMRARLLLVHSPLVGRGTWQEIASELAEDGFTVTVPDLAGTVAAGPPCHLRQARMIADGAAGQPAIRTAHRC
jgi:predicted alpha/beta hydrolase